MREAISPPSQHAFREWTHTSYLIICGSFNSCCHIAPTIQHWLTGSLVNNALEGSSHGLREVLTHHLSVGTGVTCRQYKRKLPNNFGKSKTYHFANTTLLRQQVFVTPEWAKHMTLFVLSKIRKGS
jgi:hypothetical protein